MSLKLLLYAFDWLPSVGGIQTVMMALANGLSEKPVDDDGEQIDVTLITQTAANGMRDSGLKFRVVRRPGLQALLNCIRSADIVHLAGPSLLPMGLSFVLGKKFVVEHHGYQSICPNGLLLFGAEQRLCPNHFMAANYGKCLECNSESTSGWSSFRLLILTFVRRWMTRRASVNLVPSRHIGTKIALPRTQVIYHGVASAGSDLISPDEEAAHPPERYAFIGRLVKEKGVDVLLRAAYQLSQKGYDFRLKIVGDGPERVPLENLAVELGLKQQTEFLGWMPVEAITNALAGTSTVVTPSLWEEVAPVVVLEQMMQGRLVIASDIGGLGETVDGFGLKFPVGDVDALESCMRRVIEDRVSIAELRTLAQHHAFAAYQESRMVEEHRSLYLKLAGRN